eukprot:6187660-Pleurochrysis_carterae.AAC.2
MRPKKATRISESRNVSRACVHSPQTILVNEELLKFQSTLRRSLFVARERSCTPGMSFWSKRHDQVDG